MYITEENIDRMISMLNTEMSEILREGKLNKEVICLLGEMVDVLKDIKELDDGEDMGNSYDGGYSYNRGNYSMRRRRSYDDGGSSYRRGYSRDAEKDHLMEKFMNQASTESERELVRRIMNEM